jgi:putative peptidoglycan lipid II flippase
VAFGRGSDLPTRALWLAWGSVVGSALQVLVQLPFVLQLVPRLRPALDMHSPHVKAVFRNFGPVFVSRGVVQISAYVDALLASLLPTGSVTGLANAQLLYTLPVSLFGMSVSAAELPAMSGDAGTGGERALAARLENGLRQIAFFVVPSAMAFLALGDLLAGALLQTGRFTAADARYVWAILAGSAIGLLASTLGRLYSSSFYAMHDTRTPLRYAVLRVALTTGLGYLCAIVVPPAIGVDPRWGTAGLTASAGLAGWVEFALLRRAVNRRLGPTGPGAALIARLWSSAVLAALVAWAIRIALPPLHPILAAAIVFTPYGLVYLGMTMVLGVSEARSLLARARRSRE